MEKNVNTSCVNVEPVHQQELQPSMSTSQINNNNQKDREYVSCHMCSIEVPRCFINEHYESDKHKINTKIADVALQRVQKLLHQNIVSDIDRTESLYFCPQCVISLNLKDRETHEKTVLHKKAVTVDKFLYDFYVLYAADDGNPEVARACEETVAVRSRNVDQINQINNNNKSSTIERNQLMNISEQIAVKTNDSVRNNTENVIINPLKNDAINNSNAIKVVNKTGKPSTSEVNNTNLLDVSQFCTLGPDKNQIFCKTCKVYVPNKSSNINSHEKGFKHKEVLRKIISGYSR